MVLDSVRPGSRGDAAGAGATGAGAGCRRTGAVRRVAFRAALFAGFRAACLFVAAFRLGAAFRFVAFIGRRADFADLPLAALPVFFLERADFLAMNPPDRTRRTRAPKAATF
jgi:hypothetical protein